MWTPPGVSICYNAVSACQVWFTRIRDGSSKIRWCMNCAYWVAHTRQNDGGMDSDELCAPFGGVSSSTLSPISRESSDNPPAPDVPVVGAVCPLCPPLQDNSSEIIPAVGYARLPLPSVDNSLMPDLVWVPALPQPTGRDGLWIVKFWGLGGGWPGRVRFSRRGRQSLSAHWVLVAPSGTLRTACRTMLNLREITDFSWTTRDLWNGLEYRSPPDCSSSVGDSGSTNFRETRLSRQRSIYSAMWGSCRLM